MIKINDNPIEILKFPNGETRIKIADFSVENSIIIDWKFESDSELFQLMSIVDRVQNELRMVLNFDLVMDYVPYSRMDRVEDEFTLFTLKTFCNTINEMKFDNVYITEPHSDVCVALLDNVKVRSVTERLVKKAMDDMEFDLNLDYIYYPDLTAYRRYSKMFPKNKYLIGLKKRNFDTGEITGLQIVGDMPSGRFDVIMIDDLCSKGGSFVYGADELTKLGMQSFSLVVTHCENTVLEGVLLDRKDFHGIYTTRSIFSAEHSKVYCRHSHNYVL